MTLNNLKLALQLNNAKINQEINLLITYVNQFAANQKDLHHTIDNKLQSLDDDISQLNSDMTYQISLLDTKFTNQISTLSDDYSSHKNNTDIHITAEEREKWNNTTKYTDGTIKDHAENLTIHVTQADKDIWNATLGNAKAFAQELFNRLTSFEIVKCTELPTEDIKTMTIYFLQISPEQDDLYEEYMYIDDKWEKIGNTRIDLSDYVTKSMLQSEVDTLNDAITAKEYTFNQSITNLENKHNRDIKSINQNIETIEQNIKNIGDVATTNTAGIVKPDGTTIIVSNDGSITAKEIIEITKVDFDALATKDPKIAYFVKESAASKTGKIYYNGAWFGGNAEFKSVTEWISNTDLPYDFNYGGAVIYNNEIHILGSRTSDSTKTKHYKWNGTSWVSVSTLPYSFYYGCAVVYNNEIHILGGGSGYRHPSETKHYKWDGTTWTSVSTLPYGLNEGGCAVVYNNEIHILGSYYGGKNHYKWDGSQWTRVSTLPYYFRYGQAVVLNNEIHILGSEPENTEQYHYKWNGSQWTRVSKLPYPFEYGSAVVLNNEIHILGGDYEGGRDNWTRHYKWDGSQWTSAPNIPFHYYGGSVIASNSKIYVFGGSVESTKSYTYRVLSNHLFVNNQPVNAENVLTEEQLEKLNGSSGGNVDIANLENKYNQDIKSINQNIETIEQNIKNIGDDVNGIHSHTNKSVLDNLTQSVIDNSHTHNNKPILDKLTIDNNGNLLYNGSKVCDTDELIDALNNCVTKADLDKLPIHKHSNKVLLDKLSIDTDGDLNYDGQKVAQGVGTGANHTHSNKNILDRFGIDTNNNLTYNGTEVINQFTSVDVVLLMDSLWPDQAEGGFVTKDRQYIITNDGYIFVPYS